ncbi:MULTISPECIES: hypothetical protein [Halobacterium]|uniref:hypothetical protein n=1 Tax=Halobacterium TaxID=2239 RepID=UPI00073F4D9F|nr:MULTISPECIES: hypothetical protein [Halobacterium]MCG1004200.1 hypothetical protein [Halobacterium noricense]
MATPWENSAVDRDSSTDERRDRDPGLSLQGSVFVLAGASRNASIAAALPDALDVRTFTSAGAFDGAVSGNVAVALLSTAVDDDRLRETVKRTVAASPPARICLLASTSERLRDCEVPRDEEVRTPVAHDKFLALVERLYVRAYYSVTLERFYKIGAAARSRELQVDDPEDARLERLRRAQQVMGESLSRLRGRLDHEDIDAIKNRQERLADLAADARRGPGPAVRGLPASCPDCSLDWATWHGPRLRDGHQRIGSDAWRCLRCGHVITQDDPDNYTVS